ncbi:IclR family transcriptional regulator [Desulforhopalus singaporensis]|uniref:Transcriptional regulator, IclR family n=1 Tax=Desulforhopalus singaporensis TaxID=91360 RepID=A0A1H0ITQ3_9BACT|nr:IclR family transcriptional regulator [Desulforhopalus singaporensis]SDO34864.1 transcriptional regulator, IclR family [Desulforhopalus singaporensis]
MNKQPVTTGSSVEKALAILLTFTPETTELGTTEISQKLGMHKSTTSRLIKSLVTADFLQQNPVTKKYQLGSSAYRLGYISTRSRNTTLLTIARPFLVELAAKTGESIALEMVSGIDVILAAHVEGPSHLRFNFQQGELVPLNVAAGAKVILAYSDARFLESCLKRDFKKFNDNTIVSKKEYLKVLETVKKEGIAYDRGERYHDIHAMAVPIFNPDTPPTAAIIIAGPSSRLTDDFFASVTPVLCDTAERISKRLNDHG